MRNMKISKWGMTLLGALYVLNAVRFVMNGNWPALVWEVGFIVLLFLAASRLSKRDKYIERTDQVIDELVNDWTYKNFVFAEGRAACSEQNLRRYQLENQKLRAEKEQQKILARNLCETISEQKAMIEKIKKANQKLREENAKYREEKA